MATRKPELRLRARELREAGWALRLIANEVGAALSTVSLWVRDVPAPDLASRPPQLADVPSDESDEASSERRHCGKCLRELPLRSFNRHPTGHQWWCRDCFRAYFQTRAQQHRREVSAARRTRRKAGRAFVAEYLRTQNCSDCGETDPRVLDFHHLREKRGNIADLIKVGSSVRLLEKELAKCTVLCGNCHRIRTAGSLGSWRLDPDSVEHDRRRTPGERRNRSYLRDLLMRSQCVECGDRRFVVLEFDHRGHKEANVSELARRGCSLARLAAEVARCDVRCVNCHRLRHEDSNPGLDY